VENPNKFIFCVYVRRLLFVKFHSLSRIMTTRSSSGSSSSSAGHKFARRSITTTDVAEARKTKKQQYWDARAALNMANTTVFERLFAIPEPLAAPAPHAHAPAPAPAPASASAAATTSGTGSGPADLWNQVVSMYQESGGDFRPVWVSALHTPTDPFGILMDEAMGEDCQFGFLAMLCKGQSASVKKFFRVPEYEIKSRVRNMVCWALIGHRFRDLTIRGVALTPDLCPPAASTWSRVLAQIESPMQNFAGLGRDVVTGFWNNKAARATATGPVHTTHLEKRALGASSINAERGDLVQWRAEIACCVHDSAMWGRFLFEEAPKIQNHLSLYRLYARIEDPWLKRWFVIQFLYLMRLCVVPDVFAVFEQEHSARVAAIKATNVRIELANRLLVASAAAAAKQTHGHMFRVSCTMFATAGMSMIQTQLSPDDYELIFDTTDASSCYVKLTKGTKILLPSFAAATAPIVLAGAAPEQWTRIYGNMNREWSLCHGNLVLRAPTLRLPFQLPKPGLRAATDHSNNVYKVQTTSQFKSKVLTESKRSATVHGSLTLELDIGAFEVLQVLGSVFSETNLTRIVQTYFCNT
jgi:hypothetical protein